MKTEHTESLDRAAKEYEERVMLLLSKLSNKVIAFFLRGIQIWDF
jgi:hypothetical protein